MIFILFILCARSVYIITFYIVHLICSVLKGPFLFGLLISLCPTNLLDLFT
uniref:Uncharacterized protein n=1 Tax=Rhizophora mucronata TaxID=61149 RepID=A0A2P2Q387_RHIMU